MTDSSELITLVSGDPISVTPLNSNFELLDENIKELDDKVDQLTSSLSTTSTNINSSISTVNTSLTETISDLETSLTETIEEIQDSISTLESSISSRVFTESSLTVGIGEYDLSSYLPSDENQYLVLVSAYRSVTGSSQTVSATTDIMTVSRVLLRTDADSGRNTRAVFFGFLPVGTGRTITFTGKASSLYLCGYMPL